MVPREGLNIMEKVSVGGGRTRLDCEGRGGVELEPVLCVGVKCPLPALRIGHDGRKERLGM